MPFLHHFSTMSSTWTDIIHSSPRPLDSSSWPFLPKIVPNSDSSFLLKTETIMLVSENMMTIWYIAMIRVYRSSTFLFRTRWTLESFDFLHVSRCCTSHHLCRYALHYQVWFFNIHHIKWPEMQEVFPSQVDISKQILAHFVLEIYEFLIASLVFG